MRLISFLFVFLLSAYSFGVTTITAISLNETESADIFNDADEQTGNQVSNPANDLILIFNNAGGSAAVATVTAQKTSFSVPGKGAVTKSNISITLAAGEVLAVGDLFGFVYNDSNGRVQITYSGASSASVEIAALRP